MVRTGKKRGLNSSPGETLEAELPRATLKQHIAATELADLADAHDREKSAGASVVAKKLEINQLEASNEAQRKSNDIRHEQD